MKIENCVVCGKYLKTIIEEENLMCTRCDKLTDEISNEQLRNVKSNKK